MSEVWPLPSLSEFTTMRVGGVPKSFFRAESTAELYEAVQALEGDEDPMFLLGGGSNSVIADNVENLHVVHVANRGIDVEHLDGERVKLRVQAGEDWDPLFAWAIGDGFAGLEAMSGIPGSVGATPVQNVGAYGQEVAETITAAEVLNLETGAVELWQNTDFAFAYRDSALKRGRRAVIGWVEFELRKLGGLSVPMASGQVTNHVGAEYGSQLPAQLVRDVVIELRSSKGMVVRPDDPDSVSCGSFFTNPVVPYQQTVQFPGEMLKWEMRDGTDDVKLSAGWLIENAGIEKGFALPGSKAAVSSKHALAITNRGGASAQEILELASFIQTRVHDRWGVRLVPEPNLIGFANS